MKKALAIVGITLISKIAASNSFLGDKDEDINNYVDNIQNEVITHSLEGYGPEEFGRRRERSRSRGNDRRSRSRGKDRRSRSKDRKPEVKPVVAPTPVPVPEPKIAGPVPKEECKPEPVPKPNPREECDECNPHKPIVRPENNTDDLDLTRHYVPLHVSHKNELEKKDYKQGIVDDFRDGRIKFPDFASDERKEEINKKETFNKTVEVGGDFKRTTADSNSFNERESKNKSSNKDVAKARKAVDEKKSKQICDKNYNQRHNKKYKDNNHNVGVLSSTEKCSEREHAETLQLNGSKKVLENVDLFEETNECEQIVRDHKKGERSSKQVWRKRRENKNNINENSGSHKQGRSHVLKNAGKNKNANKKCKLSKDAGHEHEDCANNNVQIKKRIYTDSDSKDFDNSAESDSTNEDKAFTKNRDSQVDGSFNVKKTFDAENEFNKQTDVDREFYVKRD